MAPYIRIATAETLRFQDRTPVTSPETYVAWQAEQLLEKGDQARPWPCDLPVIARIEHGRWLVNCVNCVVIGAMTHPVWRVACCAECGCLMRRVIVPEDFDLIERVLLERPQRMTQSWLPTQTCADLRTENIEHGVGSPC